MARRRKKVQAAEVPNFHSDDPRQQSLPIEATAAPPQVALPHEPIGELAVNAVAPEEPPSTGPERVLLRSADGSATELWSPVRLGNLVRLAGRIYELRAVDCFGGTWLRIYREVVPDEIRIAANGEG